MRFYQLALILVLASVANSLVSANDAGNKEHKMSTEAPLIKNTARPTSPPKINKPSPTKATSFNLPPKVKLGGTAQEAEQMPDAEPMPAPAKENIDPMVAMESNDAPPVILKSQEIHSHKMQVGHLKPVQVTGFITRNGNIYEIEGKDGIGLIEGRQSAAEEKQQNVCNYGSIVIYSDVPCDGVTNIKVGAVEQHSNTQPASPAVESSSNADNNDNNQEKPQNDDLEDFNEDSARRRQQQNRNRRRNRNGNRRRNGVQQRPNRNRKRQGNRVQKPAKTQQQRRQQQKKRQQMQRQQQKRRQQQQLQRQKNKKRQQNRPNQWQNQQQQNRRKVAQRQQADDYYSGDDDDDDDQERGYDFEYVYED